MTDLRMKLCLVCAIALGLLGCEKPAANAPVDGTTATATAMATATATPTTVNGRVFTAEHLEFGCGACIYNMPGVEGCPLAVVIDGTPHLVDGFEWPVHDYCDRKCHASASGTLQSDRFSATSVKPAQ